MSEYIKCPNCEQLKIEIPLKRSGCLNCSYNSLWQDFAESTIFRLERENEDK